MDPEEILKSLPPDLKLPPHWRQLDAEIFAKLALNEASIILIEKKLDELCKLLKDIHQREEEKWELAMQHYQRLDEVYYHVFPERLAQDAEVGRQFAALTSRPGSSGERKKN